MRDAVRVAEVQLRASQRAAVQHAAVLARLQFTDPVLLCQGADRVRAGAERVIRAHVEMNDAVHSIARELALPPAGRVAPATRHVTQRQRVGTGLVDRVELVKQGGLDTERRQPVVGDPHVDQRVRRRLEREVGHRQARGELAQEGPRGAWLPEAEDQVAQDRALVQRDDRGLDVPEVDGNARDSRVAHAVGAGCLSAALISRTVVSPTDENSQPRSSPAVELPSAFRFRPCENL